LAGINLSSPSTTVGYKAFTSGLNTTSGALGLDDSESPDLQNIDFNKFGSIYKRSGYDHLNTTTLSAVGTGDGLWWYEYTASDATVRKLILVIDSKLYKMDDLDATFDDVTGTVTITAGNHCDFENFLNNVYITNGENVPFKFNGTSSSLMTVPTGLTDAKFLRQYNNYLFLANCTVSATTHKSRIYWSTLKDASTWSLLDFIEVSKDDGQEITGLKVLSDRLVVFKSRSIYNVFFTGDADIPFVLPGGGKANSAVGCIAPWSIQEIENGLVFLSHDGFYFYDGSNAMRISDRITKTVTQDMSSSRLPYAVSLVQKNKNKYWCALTTDGQTTNDRILTWDWSLNSWSLYSGISAAAMCTAYVDGNDERPYFADYNGYVYRLDYGDDDYPLMVQTAIDAYYYTNWKHFDDLVDKKGVPYVTIYYQTSNSVLTLAYTYDFEEGDNFSQTMSLATSSAVYGTATYGEATYAGSGGGVIRRSITGRGRVVRFKFSNSTIGETFQIDGLGIMPHLEAFK
jgi:hypothetical protein